MRGLLDRSIDGSVIPQHSPSALWALQMTHQTRMVPSPNGRLVVTDNLYSRHVLPKKLELLSDNEGVSLGTVRMNNVDGVNRPALKTEIEELKE